VPLGVDGSRLECPRAAELERRLPCGARKGSAPAVWVTALVHLRLGLLWGWRLGLATACERSHLLAMLPCLPAYALVVADAGFNGFFQAQAILRAKGSFLIRRSSKVRLRTEQGQDAGALAGRARVLLAAGGRAGRGVAPAGAPDPPAAAGKKHEVWLLTNVLDKERLPARLAGQFYRMRWENEGCSARSSGRCGR